MLPKTMRSSSIPILIAACVMALPMAATAQPAHKITGLSVSGGKVNLDIEGPSGEYRTECAVSLDGPWVQLSRLRSDGSAQQFDDPFDSEVLAKFYRLESVPQANQVWLTGEHATALIAAVAYADLQTTFGFSFPQGEATIPNGNDLSFATRNQRIYSAVIAALAKMAKDVSDSFLPATPPDAATIAAAFAADLSDGVIDGNDSMGAVQIGATGSALPAYTAQDFLDALNFVKGEIPGLYNVEFTAAAPAAPEAAISKDGAPVAASGSGGSFSPSTPAVWGDFYWGSSEWQ